MYAFNETAWVPRILTTISYLNHHTAESVPFCVCCVHKIFDNTSSTNKNYYFMLSAKELVQQSLIIFEYHLWQLRIEIADYSGMANILFAVLL